MSSVPPTSHTYPDFDPALSPVAVDLVRRRLAELNRLAKIGNEKAQRLGSILDDAPGAEFTKTGGNCFAAQFHRVTKSVRQIVVLELELLGLRKAPPRSEPDGEGHEPDDPESDIERPERSDLADRAETNATLLADLRRYRHGPLDIVVAEIRAALGVDAPEDDPFAPPRERAAKPRAAKSRPSKHRATDAKAAGIVAQAAEVSPAPLAGTKPAKPARPQPVFIMAPTKPRRAIDRLLATTARNRGPPR